MRLRRRREPAPPLPLFVDDDRALDQYLENMRWRAEQNRWFIRLLDRLSFGPRVGPDSERAHLNERDSREE